MTKPAGQRLAAANSGTPLVSATRRVLKLMLHQKVE